MNIKSLGGVLTPNQGFIRFRCRLGNGTTNLGRTRRYQQTSAQSGISDAISHFPLEKSGDSQNPLKPNSKPPSKKRQPNSIMVRKIVAAKLASYTVGPGPREDSSSSKQGQLESESRAPPPKKHPKLRLKDQPPIQANHTQFSQSKQDQIREAASSDKAKVSTKGDEANASKKGVKAKASRKGGIVKDLEPGNPAEEGGLNKAPKAVNKGDRVQDTTERNRAAKRSPKKAPEAVKRKDTDEKTKAPIIKKKVGSTIKNTATVEAVKKKDADEKKKPPIVRRVDAGTKNTITAKVDSLRLCRIREVSREIPHLRSRELELSVINSKKLSLPTLSYGLERVLFNPGVYNLQDPRSRVFNFDPYLQTIMPVEEFNFNALNKFTTSSKDEHLLELARAYGKRYVGSTSSMTSVLARFHYLLSQWRQIDTSMLSRGFTDADKNTGFTEFQRIPSAVFLRWRDGTYAIDSDLEFNESNVLSSLGQSMEMLLTSDANHFERYRKSNSDQVSSNEINSPMNYHYSTLGNILMRSQLDAYDARLPGTGIFDIKTRSVVSIRADVENYKLGVGYQIKYAQGNWESYEREYFDMIRSVFLKYSLQVRIGRMDGIFVAYHNIDRIFGFQYISLPEMDTAIHGTSDTLIGDQEFEMSLGLFNKILDKATEKYPETSLRIHFDTREAKTPFMYIFAEPMTDVQIQEIQSKNAAQVEEFERSILGLTGGAPSKEDQQDNDPGGSLYRDNTRKDHDNENLTASSIVGDGQMDTGDREDDEVTREHADEKEVEEASDEFDEEVDGDEAKDNAGENADRETDDEKERNHNENGGLSETHTGGEHRELDEISGLDSAGRADIDEQSLQTLTDDDTRNMTEISDLDVPGEVLAMKLTVHNKVNGDYVVRPDQLSPRDDWAIEYSLVEDEDAGRAWTLYQACKRRIEKKYESTAVKVGPHYASLREKSVEGAMWREEMDRRDDRRPRVVLEPPLISEPPRFIRSSRTESSVSFRPV